jgi:uncharacterized OsmC-like protein
MTKKKIINQFDIKDKKFKKNEKKKNVSLGKHRCSISDTLVTITNISTRRF